jgi:hypothetical protein
MSAIRNFLVKTKNSNPYLLYLWTANQKRKGIANLKEYTDKEAIVSLYKNYSGKVPNLENPKTFSEKMQWLKLHYHNPLMTVCADKFELRDYLVQKGYGNLLNGVIGTYDTIGQLNVSQLPSQFVLKATHGSGWNLICTEKSKINWWIWKKIMNVWLHNNIFWPGREWPYKNMKPRLIAEPFLKDESGQLMDFKFFCFNGKAHFVQANKGRDTTEHAQNFYNLDWEIMPFGKDLKPRPDITIAAPFQLKKMAAIAEDLAADFPFVRVDFYEVNKQIIFGEMTFYPKSGLPDFTPIEYDHILGDLLQLPVPFVS